MTRELPVNPTPKLLAAIIDRDGGKRLESILQEKRAHFHYMFHAMGTASSETLKMFGLSGTEKTVCVCIEQAVKVKSIMTAVTERMEMTRPGNGIAFTIPVSGVSSTLSNAFCKEYAEHRQRWLEHMEKETENGKHDISHDLVVSVVNQGFSEDVMRAAHAAGARGGTIVHARRAGIEDAIKFFGITLQEDKEIVAILIPKTQKKELMQAVSKACGSKTDAHGFVISLPVDSCAGLGAADEDYL